MDRHTPILLLHGALGIAEDLSPLSQALKEKGLESRSFTFPGHGPAGVWPPEFRIDLFARELDRYFKEHQLRDVTVFGHSMGGYVALYHKANWEDSPVTKVFTYGTKFNWSDMGVKKELPMLDPDSLLERFPHHGEALKAKHGERWKSLLRSTAHMMQNLERLDGLTREDLQDVDVPVILMLGDQDRMVTSEETNLTASWLPDAKVKVISHSKHEMERSNLREISTIISENA